MGRGYLEIGGEPHRRRIGWAAGLAALIFIQGWATSPAWSAWPTTLNVNVPVCTASGDQGLPATVSDGAGGAIIVWWDLRGGADLYAQRVDAGGTPLWTTNGVALNTSANSGGSFVVTSDGAGGAIVGWTDNSLGYGFFDIRAQRVDSTGTPLWTANGLPVCAASNNQQFSRIISDGMGGAILTWQDNRSSGSPFVNMFDIYAQRLDAAGVPQWAPDGVAVSSATGDQTNPLVAPDGAGGAIISWVDQRAGNVDIYAQRVDATGAPQWAADGIGVSTLAGTQLLYGCKSDGAGGAILIWLDPPSGTSDVYGQRLDTAGNLLWGATGTAICTAPGIQNAPDLVSDGGGGAIVSWMDTRSGTQAELYAQRVNGSGIPQWATDGVAIRSGLPSNITFYPKIIADDAGGAILSWEDLRNGSDVDLYAQRINASGTRQWAQNGVAVCTAANNQQNQTFIPDGVGGAIISWDDFRNGTNDDVFAQRISPGGRLGGQGPDIVGDVGGQVTAECPVAGTPIAGLTVDVFETGSGDLLGTGVTDAGGNYSILNIPAVDCIVTLVTPLGYTVSMADVPATVPAGGTATVDFDLSCIVASGNPNASGFWKHEFGVATGGTGNAHFTPAALCGFLDLIETHFNNNALNQVVVYDPPDGATCAQKLEIAKVLLNLGGSPAPIDKARQQLLSLLLNVAANTVGLRDVISKDGATASQAITYCDQLIDNPSGDRTLAAAIGDKINSGQKVNAGVIPLGTAQIAYERGMALRTFRVSENPGPGARAFRFAMGQPGVVRLRVFDVAGRLVKELVNGSLESGAHVVPWNGEDAAGGRLKNGLYFARLETADGTKTLKVIQLDK